MVSSNSSFTVRSCAWIPVALLEGIISCYTHFSVTYQSLVQVFQENTNFPVKKAGQSCRYGNKKVKFTLLRTMKAQNRWVIDLIFLNLDARWGSTWSTPRLRPHYPWNTSDTHCTRGWEGPRAGMDGCEKSRPTPVFKPWTEQYLISQSLIQCQLSLKRPQIIRVFEEFFFSFSTYLPVTPNVLTADTDNNVMYANGSLTATHTLKLLFYRAQVFSFRTKEMLPHKKVHSYAVYLLRSRNYKTVASSRDTPRRQVPCTLRLQYHPKLKQVWIKVQSICSGHFIGHTYMLH
jgi:hypothetical protein